MTITPLELYLYLTAENKSKIMISDGMYLADSRIKTIKDFALEFGFLYDSLEPTQLGVIFVAVYPFRK